jgi:NFU1 iron-sulfur cluster scaffold homolog, mitochondrial
MIPIHAIATANPQQLRWVVAADQLPTPGTVSHAPGRLGELLNDGVIGELVVQTSLNSGNKGDVLITLGAGHTWRELGDDIRDALSDALLDPAGWRIDAADDTARLAAITQELLTGPIGALAESHGGSIELVSVVGNDVTVRLSGACRGCPAAASTLHDNLQRELRRRAGNQIVVCSENDSSPLPLGKRLLSLIVR